MLMCLEAPSHASATQSVQLKGSGGCAVRGIRGALKAEKHDDSLVCWQCLLWSLRPSSLLQPVKPRLIRSANQIRHKPRPRVAETAAVAAGWVPTHLACVAVRWGLL